MGLGVKSGLNADLLNELFPGLDPRMSMAFSCLIIFDSPTSSAFPAKVSPSLQQLCVSQSCFRHSIPLSLYSLALFCLNS